MESTSFGSSRTQGGPRPALHVDIFVTASYSMWCFFFTKPSQIDKKDLQNALKAFMCFFWQENTCPETLK
jgi:hypothetical protein